ncbi:MAG: hypothetical protein AAF849_18590 [Bacteroidota bacterium]
MKNILRKLKLTDSFVVELKIQQQEFVSMLKENVDEGSVGIFSDTFDVFSSSKNEFKGHINWEGFKIKRKRRFFDTNINLAVASGSYKQQYDKLIIKTEINSLNVLMTLFYVFLLLFYPLFIFLILVTDNITGNTPAFVLPFLLVHAASMLGIPYIMMRKSVKRMKYELEREFYYMVRDKSR